jgi:hypothetical protein
MFVPLNLSRGLGADMVYLQREAQVGRDALRYRPRRSKQLAAWVSVTQPHGECGRTFGETVKCGEKGDMNCGKCPH